MIFPILIDLKEAPTLIEIFEAIGVVGSLIAIIVSLIKLFRKDRDRQKQIDSLTTIAKESKVQTDIFPGQLKILTENNALYSKDLEISEKIRELNKQMRKSNIKPDFDRLPSKLGKLNKEQIFINKGGLATIIEIVPGSNNEVRILATETYKNKTIKKGEKWSIKFATSDKCHDKIKTCNADLKILLKDEDGNKYEFTIYGRVNNLKFSELTDVSPEEPKESQL